MDLMKNIEGKKIAMGQVAVTWLGQAGFILKTSNNTIITIDPYLSDCVEREFGFKRLSASILTPEDLKTDILIVTHEHLDHFDADSMPVLFGNTRKRMICSPTAAEKFRELRRDNSRLEPLSRGKHNIINGITIRAVYADHGDLAPDSIGILIDTGDFIIYYSSDTAYKPKEIAESLGCVPDLAILPINGMYGNLDSYDAAKLAEILHINQVIPCHFWTFREHNGKYGDPLSFEIAMKKHHVKGKSIFLTPGEILILNKEV